MLGVSAALRTRSLLGVRCSGCPTEAAGSRAHGFYSCWHQRMMTPHLFSALQGLGLRHSLGGISDGHSSLQQIVAGLYACDQACRETFIAHQTSTMS